MVKILRDRCRRLNIDLEAAETGLWGARELGQLCLLSLIVR